MILLHQILILQGVFPMVKNILLANHSIVINLSTFNIDIILFICSGIWTSVLVNRPKMAFIKSFFSLNIESCLGHITHLVVRMNTLFHFKYIFNVLVSGIQQGESATHITVSTLCQILICFFHSTLSGCNLSTSMHITAFSLPCVIPLDEYATHLSILLLTDI